MEPAHATLSVRQQCQLLGINRSSVYYESVKQIKDEQQKLLNLVDETYTQYPFMGTRMMADYLQSQGHE